VRLNDYELESRRATYAAPPRKFTRGWLARYARFVTNASRGAVLDPDAADAPAAVDA
jgi:dihydroxy-acid dehydratase